MVGSENEGTKLLLAKSIQALSNSEESCLQYILLLRKKILLRDYSSMIQCILEIEEKGCLIKKGCLRSKTLFHLTPTCSKKVDNLLIVENETTLLVEIFLKRSQLKLIFS